FLRDSRESLNHSRRALLRLSTSAAHASPPHRRLHKSGYNSPGKAPSAFRHSPTGAAPLRAFHLPPATTAHVPAQRSETSTCPQAETSPLHRAATTRARAAMPSSPCKLRRLPHATRHYLRMRRESRDASPD